MDANLYMSKSTGRRIYSIHKWCGLIAGLFILILGITGSILVFHKELDAFEHKREWTVDNAAPVSVDTAYHSITQKYKNWDIRLKRFSGNPRETMVFELRRPAQRVTVFVHPSTGLILKEIDSNKTFVMWLLKLHYTLHAKLFGEILVLVFGTLYFISLLTGCIVYRKVLLNMFLFRIKFRLKNKRSIASSLHGYVGVWALIVNLFIVLSGSVISYQVVAHGLKVPKTSPAINTGPIPASLDKVLADLKEKTPEFLPSYIRFPTDKESPIIFNGKVEGQAFYYSKFYNTVVVDRKTGAIKKIHLNPSNDKTTKLSSIVRGIHFVEFGNLAVKILICLFGLSAPLLSITGFLLWKWKQKKHEIYRP